MSRNAIVLEEDSGGLPKWPTSYMVFETIAAEIFNLGDGQLAATTDTEIAPVDALVLGKTSRKC